MESLMIIAAAAIWTAYKVSEMQQQEDLYTAIKTLASDFIS